MQEIIDLVSKLAHSGQDEIITIQSPPSFYGKYNRFIIENNEAIHKENTFKNNIDDKFNNIAEAGFYLLRFNDRKCTDFHYQRFCNIELSTVEYAFLMIYNKYNIMPRNEHDKKNLECSIKADNKIKDTLVVACYENNMDKIKECIKNAKRSDLGKIYNMKSPLMYCAEHDNLEAFKMLVEAGANVKHRYSDYFVLERAISYSKDITMYIYENFQEYFKKKVNDFGIAARCHDIEILELIKNCGVDLEGKNKIWPNLHSCAYHNNVEGVRFLIENGVDPLMLDRWNRTAYMVAESEKRKEVMKYLEKYNK